MRLEWLYRRAVRTALLATLLAAVQTPLLRADLAAVERGRRQLLNQREIGDEAAVAAGTEAAVKDYFFSFRDYQDLMLFHPKFGYYSSGFVSFVGDWTTYPVVLRPYFGQMIAEQIFRMWDGMRRAGTLAAEEPFIIAEFGAGDGSLAESILDYIDGQSKTASDKRWLAFAGQAVYACYDRSPALREAQRQRNARFGKRFEARVGQLAGLKPVYYGYQRALQSTTPILLNALPPNRQLTPAKEKEFRSWAVYFRILHSFKLLVQQKENTDGSFVYPDHDPSRYRWTSTVSHRYKSDAASECDGAGEIACTADQTLV